MFKVMTEKQKNSPHAIIRDVSAQVCTTHKLQTRMADRRIRNLSSPRRLFLERGDERVTPSSLQMHMYVCVSVWVCL